MKWKLDQHSSRTASAIKTPTDIVTPKATTAFPVTPEGSAASIIWDRISPTSKKKSSRKTALSSKSSTVKYQLRKHLGTRLDKVVVRVRQTITLEDNKKEHLRYRLTYLHVLHEKFLAEYKVDCSYSNFCKLVPSNIVKPKPQDWGTCLCMSCLNPQLKMEALCNLDSSLYVDTEEVIKYTETELCEWHEKIRQIK